MSVPLAVPAAPMADSEPGRERGFEVLERQLSWELETARAPGAAGLAAPGGSAAQS